MLSHIIKLILFGVVLYNVIKYTVPQLIKLFRYLKSLWIPFYRNKLKPFIKTKILPYWREIYFDDGSKNRSTRPYYVYLHWGYPKFRTIIPKHYLWTARFFVFCVFVVVCLIIFVVLGVISLPYNIHFIDVFTIITSSPWLLVKLIYFLIKCIRYLFKNLVLLSWRLLKYILMRTGCWGYWKWQYDKFWKLYLKALEDTGLWREDVRFDLRFIWNVIIYNFFLYLMCLPFVIKNNIQSIDEVCKGIKIFLKKHGRWLWLIVLFFLMFFL